MSAAMTATDDNKIVTLEPINKISKRIRAGYERMIRGGEQWVEGSVDLVTSLHAARQHFKQNIKFGQWIRQSDLLPSTYGKDELAAMVQLGSDVAAARQLFETTQSTNYRLILREGRKKGVFASSAKTQQASGRKGKNAMSYAEGKRRTKLGEDVYDQIKDTSLGNRKEMDALVALVDGFPDDAKNVITRAQKGEIVSAAAILADKARKPAPTMEELLDAWAHSQRIVSLWERTEPKTRKAFLNALAQKIREDSE